MAKSIIVGCALAGALALAGCATTFMGSAPAKDGSILVVGSAGRHAAAWLCPEKPTPELACRELDVTEQEGQQ